MDREVQLLVDDAEDVVFCVFIVTVLLPDNVGVRLLNWHQRSIRSSTRWSRVDIIHPQLCAVERVDLHLLHHAGKATIGQFLEGDAAELSNEMHHERTDVI